LIKLDQAMAHVTMPATASGYTITPVEGPQEGILEVVDKGSALPAARCATAPIRDRGAAPPSEKARAEDLRSKPIPWRSPKSVVRRETKVYLRYFVAWFPIIILAFANATVREVVYRKYVGELNAHQLSTLILCVLIGTMSGC
jgi:hypothetical protein